MTTNNQLDLPFYRNLKPNDELLFYFAELFKKIAQKHYDIINVSRKNEERKDYYLYIDTTIYQIGEEKEFIPESIKLFARKILNKAHLTDFKSSLVQFDEGKKIIDEAYFDFVLSTSTSESSDAVVDYCKQHYCMYYSVNEILSNEGFKRIKDIVKDDRLIIFYNQRISFESEPVNSNPEIDQLLKDKNNLFERLKSIVDKNNWLLVSCFPDFKHLNSLLLDLDKIDLLNKSMDVNQIIKLFEKNGINIWEDTTMKDSTENLSKMNNRLETLLKSASYKTVFDNDHLFLNNSDEINSDDHFTIDWNSTIIAPQYVNGFTSIMKTYIYTKNSPTSHFFRNEIYGKINDLDELLLVSDLCKDIQQQNEN